MISFGHIMLSFLLYKYAFNHSMVLCDYTVIVWDHIITISDQFKNGSDYFIALKTKTFVRNNIY